MMALVDTDVVTRFAFQGSIDPLTKYNAALGSSVKILAVSTTAVLGSMAAFSTWVTTISRGEDALGQLSRQTDVAVEFIGEMSYAAEQNGSSAQAMQSSIQSLSQKIGEAATRGSEDFSRLGLSVRDAQGNIKTADQVMMDFNKRVLELNLGRQQTQDLASRLGIDQSLVQLLSKSGDEIAQLRARAVELGRTTTTQSDMFLKYNDTLNTLHRSFEGLKVQIAVSAIPQLQELARTMTEWVVKNSEQVVKVFGRLVEFGGVMTASFQRMLPVLGLLAAGFIAWKLATMGVVVAMNLLAKTAIIAALMAIYLVVDDLMSAFSGGNSVLADFYENLFDRDIVEDLKMAFAFINTHVLEPTIAGFQMLWSTLQNVWQMLTSVGKAIRGMGSGVLKFIGIGGDDKTTPSAETQINAPQMDARQLMSNATSNTNNNSNVTVNQQVRMDVSSTDPVRTGEEAASALNRQTEDAFQQAGRSAR